LPVDEVKGCSFGEWIAEQENAAQEGSAKELQVVLGVRQGYALPELASTEKGRQ
jgi:hypothetical protein